jgi:D-3-phosphoglycerate dehydrogenase / 2-oxoglutarate reductase
MHSSSIVVTDTVFPNLDRTRKILSKIGGNLRVLEAPTAEAILEASKEADAMLVTYAPITNEIIRHMNRCRIIARCGIGVDNVDVKAASKAGILVTNVPDYCVDEVSDHTMALLLALIRKIPFANARSHASLWQLSALAPIHRLRGSVLGLVGFGRISQMVATKAQAFGMDVITYDPYIQPEVLQRASVRGMSFDDVLSSSDYISLHIPLSGETHHLFDANAFPKMKPTCYLVNTARGQLIDESALTHALDEGELAGAALDVLEREPPHGSLLFGRDNVILTPHIGFYSVESLQQLEIRAAEEVARVLSGSPPRNPINPTVLNR